MYLATVIDLGSRRVVGWAMADHMRAELVCDALQMAIARRQPGPGLIFHSDRGSQYTSKQFRELLVTHSIHQSLARPRQRWDNAVAEAFWVDAEGGAGAPAGVGDQGHGASGGLRVDRGLLQPAATALVAGVQDPGRT